jgi:hypothetical protein
MVKMKKQRRTENDFLPKSNVLGVSFTEANQEYHWMFSFQSEGKSTQTRFRTQDEAEEAAFALFEKLGYKQLTEGRGVYLDKKNLKRCWETRIVVRNDLVFRKHYETLEEAEEAAKCEFRKRGINWRKKRVSKHGVSNTFTKT